MAEVFWHNLSAEEVIKVLKTDREKGLTETEIAIRQREWGPNRLPEEKPSSRIRIFLKQLESPLLFILLAAGIVTLFLREYADSLIIFSVVFLNTVIGYFQENKAAKTIQALKRMIRIKAIVLRDGEKKEVFQEELVPGDIILLKDGYSVPVDARLIEVDSLRVNEAVLSGEWLVAEKNTGILPEDQLLADRDNMVFMGTIVESGRGKAVVTSIAAGTEMGKIAQSLKETKEEKTSYQKKISHFGKILGGIIIFLCLAIFVIGVATGKGYFETFLTAVAVAVAAIPEGLPVAVTLVFAFGMKEIMKKQGLVRNLLAAETLGSTTVICTDKTGTLTKAEMQLAGIYSNGGELAAADIGDLKGKERNSVYGLVLKIAVLCNEAFIENMHEDESKWVIRGRPTEKALLLAGVHAGISRENIENAEPNVDFLPFSPTYKYSASINKVKKGEDMVYVMGAPEIILQMSEYAETEAGMKKMPAGDKDALLNKCNKLTSNGFRLIAFGYKKISDGILYDTVKRAETEGEGKRNEFYENTLKKMVFVGFAALHDPIREKAKEAINLCRQAGIRPILVTGDHKLTARAVAESLGFKITDKNILEGGELARLSQEEFRKIIKDIQIYARVEPKQKLKIVEAWQREGEVVAMTGDGVNDAPALKRANIGVALGSGTDAAKEASDITLLSDDFEVLVVAVEEGRRIIDNVRKIITYLLVGGFTEVMLIGLAIIFRLPLPVLPGQILWKNMVESTPPSLALSREPKEKDVMHRRPEKADLPILTKEMNVLIFFVGLFTNLILFAIFCWFLNKGYPLDELRSIMFVGLAIDSFLLIFSCRNLKKNIWQYNPFSNSYLNLSVILGILLLIAAVYLPPFQSLLKTAPFGFFEWSVLIVFGLFNFVLVEIIKLVFIRRKEFS